MVLGGRKQEWSRLGWVEGFQPGFGETADLSNMRRTWSLLSRSTSCSGRAAEHTAPEQRSSVPFQKGQKGPGELQWVAKGQDRQVLLNRGNSCNVGCKVDVESTGKFWKC